MPMTPAWVDILTITINGYANGKLIASFTTELDLVTSINQELEDFIDIDYLIVTPFK